MPPPEPVSRGLPSLSPSVLLQMLEVTGKMSAAQVFDGGGQDGGAAAFLVYRRLPVIGRTGVAPQTTGRGLLSKMAEEKIGFRRIMQTDGRSLC